MLTTSNKQIVNCCFFVSFMPFRVRDVTPPRVTFTTSPVYTNHNLTVAWTLDEEATTACILQSPGEGATSVPCVTSWSGSGLNEGHHTLFVQASDAEGNSEQYQHRWYVDRTDPAVIVTNSPTEYSNKTELVLTLSCLDRSRCSYRCKRHPADESADFSDCSASVQVTVSQEGEYIFSAYAIDEVDNTGSVTEVRWTVDTSAPQVQVLPDKFVMCGDPVTPNVLGYPEVSDNIDPSPVVEFYDTSVAGCKTERLWVAKDMAGNHEFQIQNITFSDVVAPVITGQSLLFVPCGHTDVLFDELRIKDALNVTHACDRDVTITHTDSRPIDSCGIDLTRIWTVTDDCGKLQVFSQDIRILHLTYPDAPENGQVNVDIDHPLSWPQYPGATHYNVYIWQDGSNEPSTPTASMITTRYIYPKELYPPNTRMAWRVEYIVPADVGTTQLVPGPTWEFLTRSYPDLAVTDVQIPVDAFSGDTLRVSWTVENVGNVTTASSSSWWYDGILLSADSDATFGIATRTVVQRRFVDPHDGYISEAEVHLADGEIGNYFVYVTTDLYNQVEDFNQLNSLRRSARPVAVELTPPPNLVVQSVFSLGSTFSGQDITVRWNGVNSGLGITATTEWVDAVFLSQDEELDSTDRRLSRTVHYGALISGEEYQEVAQVTIPNAIYGAYFLIVQVDAEGSVYEHANENDNTASAAIEITLSPTPDLVVESLETPSALGTGETLTILYVVRNAGAGAPFEAWWTDAIMMVSSSSGNSYVHYKATLATDLQPGQSYTYSVEYTIPPEVPTGNYNVSVLVDDRNMVFEFDKEFNNGKWKTIHIEQRLPNLNPISMLFNIAEEPYGNVLLLNIVISNSGQGPVTAVFSEDHVFASMSSLTSPAAISPLFIGRRSSDTAVGDNYQISENVTIPQQYTGMVYFYLAIDRLNQIFEANEADNFISIGTAEITKRSGDLTVDTATADKSRIEAGSQLTIVWTVRNSGSLVTEATRWYDSFYLANGDGNNRQIVYKQDVSLDAPFEPGMQYTKTADISIPANIVGNLEIVVVTGQEQNGYEENRDNNEFEISVQVNNPPSPDIVVDSAVVKFLATDSTSDSRILSVTYVTRNRGNSMTREMEWKDRIRLQEAGTSSHVDTTAGRRRTLLSLDSYSVTTLISIPPHMSGYYEVTIALDISDEIAELYGEQNNVYRIPAPLFIEQLPQPKLIVSAVISQLPPAAETGETLPLTYRVENDGGSDLLLSSWTDAIYLHSSPDSSRRQILTSGLRVASVIQNRNLPVGHQYTTTLDMNVPYGIGGTYSVYVVLDVNGKLSGSASGQFYVMQPLNINAGSLPDLIASLMIHDTSLQSGDVVDITLTVTNAGNATTRAPWYDTIYLSDDPEVDPFDVTLRSVPSIDLLASSESYTQQVEVNIPFDLKALQYYILIEANSGRRVFETDFDNNKAKQVVNIRTAPAVDLVTQNVEASLTEARYREDVQYSWQIINNGSLMASGRKCDTVYLSADDTWEISDVAVTASTCARFQLNSRGEVSDSQTYQAKAPVPYVAEGTYNTIVRSRNNIQDLNLGNNIGISVQSISVTPQSISMNETKDFDMVENGDLAVKVTGVPIGIALLVSLKTSHQEAYHMMYLKRNQPPKQYDSDAVSEERALTDQHVILPVTKGGDYYLLLESVGFGAVSYSVTIEVKEAKFSLISVFPERVTPVGTASLRITGMLFGQKLHACIQKGTSTATRMCTATIHRYSPGGIYAKFHVDGIGTGVYSVYLQDLKTNAIAELPMSVFVIQDKPGKLSVDAVMPGTLRAGSEGLVRLNMQNTGYSDIKTPIMAVHFSGGAATVRMADSDPEIPAMQYYPFFPRVDGQPADVLPPRASRQFQVYIHAPDVTQTAIRLTEVGPIHLAAYVTLLKVTLKPTSLGTDVWDTIWSNVEYCLGPDFETTRERLTSLIEVLSKRSSSRFGLVEAINHLVLIADGKIGASNVVQFSDISHEESLMAYPLALERSYSAALSVRRRRGPMGRGWVVPILEMRLILRSSGDIVLEKERVAYVFQRHSPYMYRSESLLADTINEMTNMYQYITEGGYFFHFSKETGRLVSYGVVGTDESNTVHYTGKRPTMLEDAEGNQLHLEYNSQNLIDLARLTSNTGLALDQISYTYDTQHILRTVRKGSGLSIYEYSSEGDLSRVHFSNGEQYEIRYNEQNWLSGVGFYQKGELLRDSNFEMDCSGHLTVHTNPENVTAELLFGYGGVVAQLESPTSLPVFFQNNPRSHTREVYVGDEIVHTSSFDPQSLTITETDANGDTLVLDLNQDGDILRASTSQGVIYTNNITDGLLHQVTHPDGKTDTFQYDDTGRMTQRTLRDGSQVSYEFDERDNLVRKTRNSGETFYTYDDKNRLSEVRSDSGILKLEYTARGLPAKLLYEDGVELVYHYNERNLRTSLSTNYGYEVHYEYDDWNRLTSITDGQNVTMATFQYDRNGKLVKRQAGRASTEYSYQENSLQLKGVTTSLDDGSVLSNFAYQYDSKGYRSSMVTNDGSWSYKYDALGQLLQWESPLGYGETFSYDANRNRVTKTTKGRATDSYAHNGLNQMLKFGSDQTFRYDDNGNLVEKASSGNEKEAFTFDQEGRVTLMETDERRCEYEYSGLGIMSKKFCTDGTMIRYVTDPFGSFGSDVLSETDGDDTRFIYYAMEQGLVAEKGHTSTDLQYFVFDGDGSVTHTVTGSGLVEGNFVYDPFGNQLGGSPNRKQFGYLGQLGIRKWEGPSNMLLFRARIYDAEHGRFISPDPLGTTDEPRSSYAYAKNNPISFKDPSGRAVHVLAGTLIGGITGAVANAGIQAFGIWRNGGSWSDFSVGDVAAAAVGGAITGAAVTSGAILGGGVLTAGGAATGLGGFAGGFAESAVSDVLSGQSVDWGSAATSGLINAPAAFLPTKMLGWKGSGATAFGSKWLSHTKLSTALNPFRKTGKTLWTTLGIGTGVGNVASVLGNAIGDWWDGAKDGIGDWWDDTTDSIGDWWDDTTDGIGDWWDDTTDSIGDWWDDTTDGIGDWWDDTTDGIGDWWDDTTDGIGDWWDDFTDDAGDWADDFGNWIQDWIQSFDPNDIIGPIGYGDSRFIAPGIDMDYMIRFENDENATAPAQRVTVSCPLDEDLDPTTFRLGSFGFGDFVIDLEYRTPIYQQMIEISGEKDMHVYFQAGVDVLSKEAFWLLQTIDSMTGLPPTDPTIGFLPPNNKSSGSGEGFMKFRIQQKKHLPHGTVIDEHASIIFDENAPIETPPIFNTIDTTWPTVNVTINAELVVADGIVVTFDVKDTGSGFRDVDIFTVSTTGDVISLVTNVNQTAANLPLDAGVNHTDHCGCN